MASDWYDALRQLLAEVPVDASSLVASLNLSDLTAEATPLVLWDMGITNDVEQIAQYLYRGGPFPPQASIKPSRHFKLSEDDPRPDKTYWDCVKTELTLFLCSSEKKYKELWKRLDALKGVPTYAVVSVISAYLGEQFGLETAALSAFVAVFLYGVAKIGKEAFCRLVQSP